MITSLLKKRLLVFSRLFFRCRQLVSLGKSITDFSAEGADDTSKDKQGLEEDDDHEKLDEEMGEPGQPYTRYFGCILLVDLLMRVDGIWVYYGCTLFIINQV